MRHLLRLLLLTLLLPGAAAAQTLELEQVLPDEPWGGWIHSGEGRMSLVDAYGRYGVEVRWTPPPATLEAAGFALSLEVRATGLSEHVYAGAGASAAGALEFAPSPWIEMKAEAGQTLTQSLTVQVVPRDLLEPGQEVRLSIGPSTAPGVTYLYRVTAAAPRLAVTHDCPPEIVISALPSVNCHLLISGWRRNTADPIVVTLPNALDLAGNHANGLQVIGAGQEDVFQWAEAPHPWGLFIFACPAQPGTGANCGLDTTAPGSVTVPIDVRQGDRPPVRVEITFEAVPHP